MGSTPSTPNRESSEDLWWPIENQNLDLNPNVMERIEEQEAHTEQPEASNSNVQINSADDESVKHDQENIPLEIETSSSDVEIVQPESGSKLKISEISSSSRQSLDEFKEELRIKRELRSSAISELRNEITMLRRQLAEEKEITQQLKQERSKPNLCQICNSIYDSLDTIDSNIEMSRGSSSNISFRSELAELQLSLQNANAEILTLTSELAATKKQAKTLKEVVAASKEIIAIRETELSQVKNKISDFIVEPFR